MGHLGTFGDIDRRLFDCERASSPERGQRAGATDGRRTRSIYSAQRAAPLRSRTRNGFCAKPRWQCREPRKKTFFDELLLRSALRARMSKRAIRNLRRAIE